MINVGTVFSGIGAVEHALDLLGIDHRVIFACDNGERKLKTEYKDIVKNTQNMTNEDRNKYISEIYDKEAGVNYVEQSYKQIILLKMMLISKM